MFLSFIRYGVCCRKIWFSCGFQPLFKLREIIANRVILHTLPHNRQGGGSRMSNPQALVSAGTAEGGTMQYALGTATEATEQYTTSIPTGTNAGT
jgi:hypothetical protein